MNAAPMESPERERERVVVFRIIAALGALALAYGIPAEHPPAGLILGFILVGAVFTATLLWGKHCKHRFPVYFIAYGVWWEGSHIVERIFIKRPCESPWAVLAAEFGAVCLGAGASFAVYRLLRKGTRNEPECA